MDNVKFHNCKEFERIIKEPGYLNVFVPLYSTFLNQIENLFSKWKEYVRRQNPGFESEFLEIIGNGCDLITTNDFESFFFIFQDILILKH